MSKLSSTRTFVTILLLAISLRGQTRQSNGTEKVYIGILDDAREEMVNWKPGVAVQRVIRPVFEKTADQWTRVDQSSVPAHMEWTVAFDGRNLGQVKSKAASSRGLTSVQTILTSASSIPAVGSPSNEFAGIMAYGPGKMRRPLVALSKPYFRDPDGWKRTKLKDDSAASVRKAFRHAYPHANLCKDEAIVKQNWKFPDKALGFPVVYGSNKRSFLVETHLNAGDCGWVDAPDDPQSDPWFFVSSTGTARGIGSFLSLLDAGDYDNDGKSEVIFFLSQGENTDGFVLFDASFEKQVSLTWNYH